MIPVRVVAQMVEPVVYSGDGLHLDGPVAYGYVRGMSPRARRRMPPISDPWALDFRLPLGRWSRSVALPTTTDERLCERGTVETGEDGTRTGRVWGWACSAAHADWALRGTAYVRKRPATEEATRWSSDRTWNTGSGRSKARNVPYPTATAREVHWYALGDPGALRDLLTFHVRAVGKLTNHGWGRVRRWTVEPFDGPWEDRRFPVGGGETTGLAMAGIRAPYHHPSRRLPCVELDWMGLRPC